MFRIFLKQDNIYPLKKYEKNQQIDQYCQSSLKIIETFKKLMKAVFPRPESDFKMRLTIENNKGHQKAAEKKKTNLANAMFKSMRRKSLSPDMLASSAKKQREGRDSNSPKR